MTYLQLINKVLVGLREPQVTAVPTSGYPALVAQLVNEAKEDIEDLGPWYPLRGAVSVNTVAGSLDGVSLSTSNERSYLTYLNTPEGSLPQAFIVTSGYERRLRVIPANMFSTLHRLYPDADHACPTDVTLLKVAGGVQAFFWPIPDAVYAARFDMINPQAELTSASTSLLIPSRPVWQEALVRAMEERGEEFSGSVDVWRARAAKSLESAILADFGAVPLTFSAE